MTPLQPVVIVLLSSVTAPFRAKALPQPIVAPVFRVMLWSAMIFPSNAVVVSRVAELTTCQINSSFEPGFSITTLEPGAVFSVLPIWNTYTALLAPPPLR